MILRCPVIVLICLLLAVPPLAAAEQDTGFAWPNGARAAISQPRDVAVAHRIEPATNMVRANSSTVRRPCRSDSGP